MTVCAVAVILPATTVQCFKLEALAYLSTFGSLMGEGGMEYSGHQRTPLEALIPSISLSTVRTLA